QEEHPERLIAHDQRNVSASPCTQGRLLRRHERVVLADVANRLDENRLASPDSVGARKLQIDGNPTPLITGQVRIRPLSADDFEHRLVVAEKLESTGVRAGARDSM